MLPPPLSEEASGLGKTASRIQYLVLSGGGLKGVFTEYGVLRRTCTEGLWRLQDIKAVFGTSAGSLVVLMIVLLRSEWLDWAIMDDFLIKRPWERVFARDKMLNMSEALLRGGVMDKTVMEAAFAPLFHAAGLDTNVTLLDLYKWSGVSMHVFCVEMNELIAVDMSHTTHPKLRVVDALWRSCSIPMLFAPDVDSHQRVFLDGSIMAHYPLGPCLAQPGCCPTTVLGVKSLPDQTAVARPGATDMVSLVSSLVYNVFLVLNRRFAEPVIAHELLLNSNHATLAENYATIYSEERRRQLVFSTHFS
jgi:predicted acylesterase/phospholipase RssA